MAPKELKEQLVTKRWDFWGVFFGVDDRCYERCYTKKACTVWRKQSKNLSGSSYFKKLSVFLKSTVSFLSENP